VIWASPAKKALVQDDTWCAVVIAPAGGGDISQYVPMSG
jgi:hypothetical protein